MTWRRRVRKGRNSLSASGDSVAASGRVVAEPIICGRLLVAVCGKCEVDTSRFDWDFGTRFESNDPIRTGFSQYNGEGLHQWVWAWSYGP
jgi:hypothetical protein